MTGPTPRQQAGYLKRLLRRGEIEIVDSSSGRSVPASVSLSGRTIRITPSTDRLFEGAKPEGGDDTRWQLLLGRLRESATLEEAEELIRAVEYEGQRKP